MGNIIDLLAANGIDPKTAKIIRTEKKDLANSIVYVEFEGVEYKLDGLNKSVVSDVTKNDVKKPRGWHFRAEYIDSEGNVYHKGVEQPELKGTITD